MPFHPRPRRLAQAALTVALALFVVACGNHPDSIFHNHTDVNRDVDSLWAILFWAGGFVFVFVECILVYTLFKFRHRPGQAEPKHVHGNTTLEITWTVIPLLILAMIAIPTIRTIFRTQAVARPDALQVEVIGHQWWWEFRYPQYNIVTANELYLPIGRTVNFTLHSQDVIHSFWVPGLAGKRDVIPNRTNYLWYTPDSTAATVYNGACVEYCGTNHGNMRFKAFTVSQADFQSWAKHQEENAAGTAPPALTPGQAAAQVAQNPNTAQQVRPNGATSKSTLNLGSATGAGPTAPSTGRPGVGVPTAADSVPVGTVAQAGFIAYPRDQIPAYAIPQTPLPGGLQFDDALLGHGDPANGAKLMAGQGTCMLCHSIKGNPMMVGTIGPNLTHIATRTTIGAGIYPNDARHLARWIKNARRMKPDIVMPTLGKGQYDPFLKATQNGGLTDQQIADIVAYLETLK